MEYRGNNVIDEYEEEYVTKNRSLRDSTEDFYGVEQNSIYTYYLYATRKVVLYPEQKIPSDSQVLKFLEKDLVVDFVKRFGEVKV